ncbi:MAG TPA: sigma-70 family RNA polymerase sigma factor [Gemmatimonadaceae bacterium]|nr:sigma-70 family RNA polymerase sigma factor [Gemmatimonadaceae bacterium]
MNERELLTRAQAGDPVAERAIYDTHVDRVYRLAFRLAGDAELAKEFTQDAFVRAFERLATFRGDSALSTWLHAITVSVALNGLRKVRRLKREVQLEHAESLGSDRPRSDPLLRQRLDEAIDKLPTGYRTVFLMHDVQGFTHEEIGAALGIEVGTSKAQLFRARARLRERLADLAGAWSA